MEKLKQSLLPAVPYIVLLLGLFAFSYGTLSDFENVNVKLFWSGIGKTLIASGIFALLLKTIQFMGVFKEELSKVVYDAKFLANRKDLEEVWGNVSKVLFKNKFPKISKEIINDIGHLYFPTDHVLYYDDYKQIIEIEVIDPINQMVKVMQHSTFTVYPKSKGERLVLTTNNSLKYNTNKSEVYFAIKKFNINDKNEMPVISEQCINNQLKTTFSATLVGEDSYKFNTCIEKKYSLLTDNVIGTTKDYIIHDFSLKIHIKGGINIDFYSAGTLNKFNLTGVANDHYREYEYKGIIYPKQGYLMFITKK